MEYAADDARLLLGLGEEIERRLAERGRLEWAREESRVPGVPRRARPRTRLERLPRLSRLDDGERAVARAVVEWRETSAGEGPSGGLRVPDQALIELARRGRARGRTRADPRTAGAEACTAAATS